MIHRVVEVGTEMNPSYQRGLVWTDNDKQELLESLFTGVDIGKFVFVQRSYSEDNCYEILDGKQRLTALVDYYLNKYSYHGLYFNDLSIKDRRWFMNYSVAIADIIEPSEKMKYKIFIKLNTTGHVVDKEHLNKIKEIYNNMK